MLPEPVWEEFARRYEAEISDRVDLPSNPKVQTYQVYNPEEFTVSFQWPGITLKRRELFGFRTEFYFFLNPSGQFFFKACRRGVMERLYYLFREKFKTGDFSLDDEFIFFTDHPEIAELLAPKLWQLENCSRRFDFELEINEPGRPGLQLVVGTLLRKPEDIEAFFRLGKTLQEKINGLGTKPFLREG
jgi:hypothetical protein